MLKKIITTAVIGVGALLLTGCTLKSPGMVNTVDISKVDMNTISTMKEGEACHSWFLFIPTGLDATVKTAAENGHITKVKYVEYTHSRYLMGLLAGSDCIKVYGE